MDASIPNFLCPEHMSLGDGYLKTPLVVKNGFVEVPTGPGLGTELDAAAVAKKIGYQWKNTESSDEDDGLNTDILDSELEAIIVGMDGREALALGRELDRVPDRVPAVRGRRSPR